MKIKSYHISPTINRESILKEGIKAKDKKTGRIKYGPRIYFSINKKDLAFDYVNFENVDCWEFEVDWSLVKKDSISHSKAHFYIETNLKPHQIKLIESY